jgi:nucleoside-diphosphate-sugar epimerase
VGAADYRASNVELVEKLLRAAQGKVKRFVYVSSVGVYGFPDHLPITEETPFAPVTLYSATKVEAEKLVRTLSPQLGVEWVIARPTIIYGKGDDNGMLDKMVRMIRAGSYRIVGGGKNTLHHTHVDDIVQGIWLCATAARAAGDDFILAGPETTTLEGLSSIVAARAGEKLPRLKIPLGFARAVATVIDVAAYRGLVFDKKEPPINHEKLDVMCRSIAFDPGKAKRLLGYAPAVGYVEGVKKTLE